MKSNLPFPYLISASIFIVLIICEKSFTQNIDPPKERYSPFCVATDSIKEGHLDKTYSRFKKIFDRRRDKNDFVYVSRGTYSPRHFVNKIEFSRIHIDDPEVDEGGPLNPLLQWMHITVTAGKEHQLVGLYLQPIAGPIGVPKGQFRTDFQCSDCTKQHLDMNAVPCKFRPGSSIRHPQVLIIGGREDSSDKPFQEAHFHFNWVDHYMDEFAYFQFLVVAVKNFEIPHFDIYFTNIMDAHRTDTPTGLFSPFYGGWNPDNIHCHISPLKNFQFKSFDGPNKTLVIRYNQDYDECIQEGTKLSEAVCPPGAFTPSEVVMDESKWTSKREGYLHISGGGYRVGQTICFACGNYTISEDECEKDPTPDDEKCHKKSPIDDEEDEEDEDDEWEETTAEGRSARWSQKAVFRIHGLTLVFCFTFPMSIGFFYGRFLKENTELKKETVIQGLGNWLLKHAFYSYLSLIALSTGAFIMYGGGGKKYCAVYNQDTEDNQRSWCYNHQIAHFVLGLLSILLFFVSYFSSWWRPDAPFIRTLVIFFHVVGGYGSKYLALLCLAFTNVKYSIMICWAVLEVLLAIVFILATVLQCSMDTTLQIAPKRRWFPVLEGIAPFPIAPGAALRSVLFYVHYILQLIGYGVLTFFYIWDTY